MGRIAGVTPDETRERLLDAAARVFELKGYEGATVALIAREAGVTTGAIYAHYSSKAELVAAALRSHSDRATASLFSPGTKADAASLLIALGSRLSDRNPSDAALLVEALLASRRDLELAEVLSGALGDREAMMTALLADGQARGVLSDELSPAVAARFALMVGLGSMLTTELDLPPVDPAEWASFIRRLVGSLTEERTE